MITDKKEVALIDVRTKDEFNNASRNSWQNVGQIKGAVNIPFSELKTSPSLLHQRTERSLFMDLTPNPKFLKQQNG
jgi:3-mercaptopyruvate sulfurtransferase SseA